MSPPNRQSFGGYVEVPNTALPYFDGSAMPPPGGPYYPPEEYLPPPPHMPGPPHVHCPPNMGGPPPFRRASSAGLPYPQYGPPPPPPPSDMMIPRGPWSPHAGYHPATAGTAIRAPPVPPFLDGNPYHPQQPSFAGGRQHPGGPPPSAAEGRVELPRSPAHGSSRRESSSAPPNNMRVNFRGQLCGASGLPTSAGEEEMRKGGLIGGGPTCPCCPLPSDEFPPDVIDQIVEATALEAGLSTCEHSVVKDELYRNFIRTYDALRDAIDSGQLHFVLHPVLADVMVRKTIEVDQALAEEEKMDAPDQVANPAHFRHGVTYVHQVAMTSPTLGKIIATHAMDVSARGKIQSLLDKLGTLTQQSTAALRLVYLEQILPASSDLNSLGVPPGSTLYLFVLPHITTTPQCPNCFRAPVQPGKVIMSIPQKQNNVFNVCIPVPPSIQNELTKLTAQRALLTGGGRGLHDSSGAVGSPALAEAPFGVAEAVREGPELGKRIATMAELDHKARQQEARTGPCGGCRPGPQQPEGILPALGNSVRVKGELRAGGNVGLAARR